MKAVKVLNKRFNNYILNKVKVGDIIEVFELEELKQIPNISMFRFNILKSHSEEIGFIGFVKASNYTDKCPIFIAVYEGECEVID